MNAEITSVLVWAAVAIFGLILLDRQATRLLVPKAEALSDEDLKKRLAAVEAIAKKALGAASSAQLAAGVTSDERHTRKG